MANSSATSLQITLTPEQAAVIAMFQQKEGLPSQSKAIELLLDIAIETVTSSGRRFWDKPIVDREG